MWYRVDIPKLSVMYLPNILRKPALAALAQVVIKPLEELHYKWQQWRADNIYKLEHNWQVCYMRKALNDSYDPVQRRIYIGDGNVYDTTYIYTEVEAQRKDANTEDEDGVISLRTEDETADTGLDFIVWVPQEVYNTSLEGLRSKVELYKLAGPKYDIMIIP